MNHVLVVEDEEPISNIISFSLKREGYQVDVAFDGNEAVHLCRSLKPNLVLLDLMLPERDGFEVCRDIRTFSTVPIIMLTARDSEVDKVVGLELGADDYVTKPFSMRELLARVKANLRRFEKIEANLEDVSTKRQVSQIGDIVIDESQYVVTKRGEVLPLTHREFELISFLSTRPGMVYTRDQLLLEVWGADYDGDARTVDVMIRRLREKLEDDPANPVYVLTKRGVGYFVRR